MKFKTKDLNFLKLGGTIFIIGGVLFLALIFYIFLSTVFERNKMDASVVSHYIDKKCHVSADTDGGTNEYCSPVFYYKVGSVEYKCSSSVSSTDLSVKSNIVYYNSNNPNQCISEHEVYESFTTLYFLIIPLVFLLLGIYIVIHVSNKVKKIKSLLEKGTIIRGLPYKLVLVGNENVNNNIKELYAFSVNYQSPTGEIINLVDRTHSIEKSSSNPNAVDLLIDPNDLSNYYIDFNIKI